MDSDVELKRNRKTELNELYLPVRGQIVSRLRDFRTLWETGSDEDLFRELTFCLLTPQSRAKICWRAVLRLERKCLLLEGESNEVEEELVGVRFSQKKAEYICLAKVMFSNGSLRSILAGFESPQLARGWLVLNVKGLGYKEASHFLRNIGLGEDLAILDRHILRNLNRLGVVESVPFSLGRKTYMEIEQKMKIFSEEVGIPLSHLDLLLWYKEAGEVFK